MEEVENIKRLLLSDDSKEFGLELAKSQNLVNEVVESLSNEVKRAIGFFNYYEFKSWKIILKSTTIDYGFNGLDNSTYDYHIICIVKGKKQKFKGSKQLYHFAKKREDLIKELNK